MSQEISITAYTRSSDTRKRLHIKTYQLNPGQPPHMEVRVGDVAFYISVEDAAVMAEAMLAAIRQEAAA